MKAIMYSEYGGPDVLQLQEVEKPHPGKNEVLVKIHATTVNYGDLLARRFSEITPSEFNMLYLFWLMGRLDFGWRRPKRGVLGSEFSGEIESVGESVSSFQPGDRVFGYTGQKMGTYAEYLCLSDSATIVHKPENMNFEEAAVIPMGSIMALHLLRQAALQPGEKILIIGASGSIGSAGVQLASHYFGAEVTGVCGTRRVEFVRSLGAQKVIDYTQENFEETLNTYDVIFDVLGKSSFSRIRHLLNPGGRYLRASFKMRELLLMLGTRLFSDKRVICSLAPGSAKDLQEIKQLVEEGKIIANIDRTFAMEEAVQAHRYVETGQKQGHVVLNIYSHNN